MVGRKNCARELIQTLDNSEDYLKLDDFNGVGVLSLDEWYLLRTTKYIEHILYSLLSFLVHFGALNFSKI